MFPTSHLRSSIATSYAAGLSAALLNQPYQLCLLAAFFAASSSAAFCTKRKGLGLLPIITAPGPFSAPPTVLRGGDDGLLLSLATLLRPLLILLSRLARWRLFSLSLIVGMLVTEGMREADGRADGAREKDSLGEVILGLNGPVPCGDGPRYMLLTLAAEFHSDVALW